MCLGGNRRKENMTKTGNKTTQFLLRLLSISLEIKKKTQPGPRNGTANNISLELLLEKGEQGNLWNLSVVTKDGFTKNRKRKTTGTVERKQHPVKKRILKTSH